jgi:hypothetical protein
MYLSICRGEELGRVRVVSRRVRIVAKAREIAFVVRFVI